MRLNVYDYMILILVIVAVAGLFVTGMYHLQQLIVVPVIAAILDYVIKHYRFKSRQFPKTAIISGLLVAMIIETFVFAIAAAVIAILSKHVIARKSSNIFNPAALAIIMTGFFGAGASWWAASTPLVLLGVFIIYKIRKMTLAIQGQVLNYLSNITII